MPQIAHSALESLAGYAATIHTRQHRLIADEPASRGGTDTGPAPYELLLSGLAACTAITLRMYAVRKGWKLGTIHVDVVLHKDTDGGGDRITRLISFTETLNDDQRAKLAEIAEKTPVTSTIKAGASIETTLRP